MSAPTHTPGPWIVAGDEPHANVGVICVEHPCWGAIDVVMPRESNDDEPDEHQANARLIAAAPDLLVALKLLWHEVTESGNAYAEDYGWPAASKATMEALAKAEGR